MKLVSWNVNGIRAAWDKGFCDYVKTELPDVLCLQETKAQPDQVDLGWAEDLGYTLHWNSAEKKGYSGTAILSKVDSKQHSLGLGVDAYDNEGRIITLDCGDFHLLTVYTPNSQRELVRLDYRMDWDREFRAHITRLDQEKPLIFCGDLNCAHQEIDLANPKSNRRNAGFTDEERESLTQHFQAGFKDSFRELHPDEPDHYSWWTYRFNARSRNVGWRIDLLLRFREDLGSGQGSVDPLRYLRLRSLSGGTGIRIIQVVRSRQFALIRGHL